MKKTDGKTAKNELLPALFLVALIFTSGCGGGGSSTVAPPQPSVSQPALDAHDGDLAMEVPYDIDVVLEDGRTAGRSAASTAYSSELNDVLSLISYFETLPDDAYNIPPVWKVVLGRVKEKRLVHIANDIERKIENENYRIAYLKIARKLLPRVDGCDGGNPADDYIVDCPLKSAIYAEAVRMMTLIEQVMGTLKIRGEDRADDDEDDEADGDKGREARAVDLTTFKNSLLNSIDTIKGYIQNAPDSAFSGVVADPRGTLLGILTVAANYIIDGNFTAAKDELQITFLPLVDGGAGGDPSNDLINSWVYSTAEYASAMDILNRLIRDVTITQVTVTPASGVFEAGRSLQFNAVCLYSDLVEKECNAELAWVSSDPAVADFTAPGLLTGFAAGSASICASAENVNSGWLPVRVVAAGVFWDPFDLTYLDPLKWSDAYQYASTIGVDGARLHFTGGAYSFAQLIPTQYFNVEAGEQVSLETDFDLGTSGGFIYVQGFGMFDRSSTGVAVGIVAGTGVSSPYIYLSSPNDYQVFYTLETGKFSIMYQNGAAKLYLNGKLMGQIAADLEGKRVTFFVYGTTGGADSYMDLYFDNFITNQPDPGERTIAVENGSRPFNIDGSGGLLPGETFILTVTAPIYQTDVTGKVLDASTLQPILPEFEMRETATLGTYQYTGAMPVALPSVVAFSASDDGYTRVQLYTRRITTGASAARALARETGTPLRPADFLPEFLLPLELRDAI
ncbi:MAG: Ig-like domain-containing protein [bacterium]